MHLLSPVFNQLGELERCALRPGNVHSANGWRAVLEPVVTRYRGTVKRLYFRGDAAFANPEIYEFLLQSPRRSAMRAEGLAEPGFRLARRKNCGDPPM